MEYKKLGNTTMNVSKLSLGGASLGPHYDQNFKEEEGIKIVHKALENGINFIDTSPFYGIGKSEIIIGKALSTCNISREKYYIATKLGRYGLDNFDFSSKRVIKSVDESLERLNLEYIDLIQCHDIEFGNLDQIINETLPTLKKLKDSGKIHYIGITGFPLKIFKYILDRDKDKIVDTILSYCHYSLNNDSLETLFPYLKEKNVGIINAASLSMGLLTRKGPPSWHPASTTIKNICASVVKECYSKGIPLEELAIQFSLANSNIDTTLVGAASVEELMNDIKCFENFKKEKLSTFLIQEIQNVRTY
jgi:L-galactose dehydrogenase